MILMLGCLSIIFFLAFLLFIVAVVAFILYRKHRNKKLLEEELGMSVEEYCEKESREEDQ